MTRRGLLTLAGGVLLILLIAIGGPLLSSTLDKNYRSKVDKSGVIIPGVVYNKKTHKGNTVHFRYKFKNRTYFNNEGDLHFDAVKIGDSVLVMVDTADPSRSYIFSHILSKQHE